MTQLESGIYVVHSVESGSVLTLFSPSQPNVPPFQISLTGVVCPRVARFVGQELVSDEPLGFEAREFVRKRIIGKSVQFTNDGKIEAIQRVVGRISLQDGEDIGLALATSGLGHVQERQGKGSREYMEKLIIANEKAKGDRIGIYAKDAAIHVRNMKPAPPEDPHALFSVLQKDPKHKVLVERVTSGSSMIATIIAFNQQCALNMWGISCPSLREPSTEKVALEAKFHTERCLLHREIHISFVSVSPNGSFNVNVVSGTNIFQEDLLRRGLAKTMQSVLMGSASREQFIAAEKSAQERKLGVWLDYAVPQTLGLVDKISSDYRGDRSFVGKVFQILSGDTICVYRENVKELVKLSLASVRPSRSIIRDQDGKDTRIRYENYTYEAREALRRFCIGKEVQVCIDYVRTIEETKELRPYATVVLTSTNQNVGEYLISEGLAKAMCHGQEVASCVEQLRDAESLAIQKKIGLHSSKESPPVRMVELFRPTEKKARQYLSYFQRGAQAGRPPRLNAIVEMVLGASMIRVCIPSESTIITLKLAGVMGPQGANADSPADLLADEAKHFVMDLIQNRDVMIEVETVDKHGTFLGSLYHDGQNLGITLVKKGLAVVANADRLPFVAELKSAEKQAQNARIGVWKEEKYMPARVLRSKERHERLAPGTLVMSPGEKFVPIMVTEVLNPTAVYMSFLDDSTKSRRGEVEALLQSFVETHDKYSPKKDEMVIAKFSEDNTWYRARVLNVNVDDKKNRTFHVRYIDFGNTETRLATDIRKCEHDKLRTLAPLAFEACLAFLKPLPKMFHAIVTDSIRAYLEDATKLYAKQEYICGTQKYYSISKQPEGNEEALAFKLAESGTGVVHPPLLQVDNSDIKRIVGELTRRQEAAQKSSANVWQYGTALIEDDDEDNE